MSFPQFLEGVDACCNTIDVKEFLQRIGEGGCFLGRKAVHKELEYLFIVWLIPGDPDVHIDLP